MEVGSRWGGATEKRRGVSASRVGGGRSRGVGHRVSGRTRQLLCVSIEYVESFALDHANIKKKKTHSHLQEEIGWRVQSAKKSTRKSVVRKNERGRKMLGRFPGGYLESQGSLGA